MHKSGAQAKHSLHAYITITIEENPLQSCNNCYKRKLGPFCPRSRRRVLVFLGASRRPACARLLCFWTQRVVPLTRAE